MADGIHSTTDDRDLIRALDGDPAAVEEFYRRHVRPLTRHVTRILGDSDEAADVVAATFLAAMESAARFDPAKGEPRGWLFGIAGNLLAVRWRRRAAEARAVSRLEGQLPPALDEYEQADELIDARRMAGPALAALPGLPPAERELLHLMTHRDLTVGEAADILGIRAGTARMRLARARTKLVPVINRSRALARGEDRA